eukprot:scaffold23839_cov100-Isochrysis_galbana.AAC.1
MARSSAPAVPQIVPDAALTSLSFPVLASVGGNFTVRHTHPPASHTSCLPAVCALGRLIRLPPRASMCPSPRCI